MDAAVQNIMAHADEKANDVVNRVDQQASECLQPIVNAMGLGSSASIA